MIYNLLIADDEYFIRQKIKKIIDFELLNLQLIGEASNGKEAIEILSNCHVDIILLDINMPLVNGLDIAKFISINAKDTQIIVLSGYANFDYAQQLMKYGIKDYILKPITEQLLNATLEKVLLSIKKSTLEQIQVLNLRKNQKIHDFKTSISQECNHSELLSQYPYLNQYPLSMYLSIYKKKHITDFIFDLEKILQLQEVRYQTIHEDNHMNVIQVFFISQPTSLLEDLKNYISNSKSYIFISCSNVFTISDNWLPHYTQSFNDLDNRYFYNETTLRVPNLQAIDLKDISKVRGNIIKLTCSKKDDELKFYINKLIASSNNTNTLRLLVHEILISFCLFFDCKECIDVPQIVASILSENTSLDGISHDIIIFQEQYFRTQNNLDSDVLICNKIIKLIGEKFNDFELSVNLIADTVSLTPSYIGSIFKKIHKKSIIEYITDIRLEKAKILLRDESLRISDISIMVGYSDVYYFSKRFKQVYGYSPKQHKYKSST